jgi:hypothetical protein
VSPGYWHATFWTGYWPTDYWPEYGAGATYVGIATMTIQGLTYSVAAAAKVIRVGATGMTYAVSATGRDGR